MYCFIIIKFFKFSLVLFVLHFESVVLNIIFYSFDKKDKNLGSII